MILKRKWRDGNSRLWRLAPSSDSRSKRDLNNRSQKYVIWLEYTQSWISNHFSLMKQFGFREAMICPDDFSCWMRTLHKTLTRDFNYGPRLWSTERLQIVSWVVALKSQHIVVEQKYSWEFRSSGSKCIHNDKILSDLICSILSSKSWDENWPIPQSHGSVISLSRDKWKIHGKDPRNQL